MYFVQGLLLGLSISVVIGPMIFLFLNASIERGVKGGLIIGAGAWVSDLLYIVVSILGLSYITQVLNSPYFKSITGLLGGLTLLIIGVMVSINARRLNHLSDQNKAFGLQSNFSLFLKGFLINTLNPFCAIIWVGAVSTLIVSSSVGLSHIVLFVIGSLGTIILTDILKIYFSQQIVDLLTPERQCTLKKVAGMGFFIFGIVIITRVMFLN